MSAIPLKKLLKTALYTSALIGIIGIAPLALNKSFDLQWLVHAMLFHTAYVFFTWLINIALVYVLAQYRSRFAGTVRYLLSYVICVSLVIVTTTLLEPYRSGKDDHLLTAFALIGFALNTIILMIQDLILLREKKSKIEIENAQLRLKNAEATNQQLKQQVHPHFLFNSLNTLKALIVKHPAKAEDYLLKLSDFLRASLASDTANTLPLVDELKTCSDYLEMQKMRFGQALHYSILIPEPVLSSGFVPVFSLLPLLENAIKHNVLTTELPLHISITYNTGRIVTANNLQPKQTAEAGTGLGLANLAKRYHLLCGDDIQVSATETTFSVSIKILDK